MPIVYNLFVIILLSLNFHFTIRILLSSTLWSPQAFGLLSLKIFGTYNPIIRLKNHFAQSKSLEPNGL